MIINGNLDLSDSSILSLGNLQEVKGSLNLYLSKSIIDLGQLKNIYGNLTINSIKIKSTGLLRLIKGDCRLIECTSLITLNKLKKVSGILNLYYCSSLKSLGKLKMRDNLIIYVNDSGITKSYVNENFKEYKKCFNWSL